MRLRNRIVSSVIPLAVGPLAVACSGVSDPTLEEEVARADEALSPATSAVAFQGKNGSLSESGPDYTGSTSGVMMAGTSPSIAELDGGYYMDAFQGKDGYLWVNGPNGPVNQWLGMDNRSSPSIAGLTGGGYQVAFQANTHNLWVTGTAGTGDQWLGMMPGTSPSITAVPGGGWEAAFQANTGNLWITGTLGTGDTGLKMAPNTSPSIAATPDGNWQVAFQGTNNDLWVYGTSGTGDQWLGMMPGTSPSISPVLTGGFEMAFQANTGNLWITGTLGTDDVGLGMMAGTSPSITALPGGGWEVAFQANTGHYWLAGTQVTGDTNGLMAPGTSPSICPVYAPGLSISNFAKPISGTSVVPVSGTRDLLIVCMDKGTTDPMPSLSDIQTLGGQVQAYFRENSGGRLTFNNLLYQGCGGSTGTFKSTKVDRPVPEQWTEALNLAVANGFNFRQYDRNGDSRISGSELAVAVIRQTEPGGDYGTEQVATFEQPGGPYYNPVNMKADVADIYLTPGVAPIKYGLVSHELLHDCANTIDLYNDIPAGQPWRSDVYSIMDNHRSGTHLDPIHKLKLGWSAPALRSLLSQEFVLGPVETTGNIAIIADSHGSRESFVIENRSMAASAFDANLPQDGVLVWRVVEDTNLAAKYSPTKNIERWGWQLLTPRPLQPLSTGGTAFELPWLEGTTGYKLGVISNVGGIARIRLSE